MTAGSIPDVAKLIPAAFCATVTADAAGLAKAVKRLAVVAAWETPVRLAVGPGQMELAAARTTPDPPADTCSCPFAPPSDPGSPAHPAEQENDPPMSAGDTTLTITGNLTAD